MYLTRKAKQFNEDGILYKLPFYMVIDGATPLTEDKKSAYLLKTYIIRNFIKIYEVQKDIKKTLHVISRKYHSLKKYDDKEPIDLPSAALAVVIEHESTYELFLLGDTSIAVLFKSGDIKLYHDNRLTLIDEKTMEIRDKKERLDQIKLNRNQLGKLYDAFIPSDHLTFKDHVYHIPKDKVRKIRLYSDGFSSIMDTYQAITDLHTFMETDIKTIAKRIEDISFKDKAMHIYPRFKVIDDISVIEIVND